jgi:hypothetical protein
LIINPLSESVCKGTSSFYISKNIFKNFLKKICTYSDEGGFEAFLDSFAPSVGPFDG